MIARQIIPVEFIIVKNTGDVAQLIILNGKLIQPFVLGLFLRGPNEQTVM